MNRIDQRAARSGAVIALAMLLIPIAVGAQTCRTSQVTGTIVCDNGATARTSPVTGTTTFTDGRTAQTSPVTGNARFSDGTTFRTERVETSSPPLPARIAAPARLAAEASAVPAAATRDSRARPVAGKRRVKAGSRARR